MPLILVIDGIVYSCKDLNQILDFLDAFTSDIRKLHTVRIWDRRTL